jgi:hypothetical protein
MALGPSPAKESSRVERPQSQPGKTHHVGLRRRLPGPVPRVANRFNLAKYDYPDSWFDRRCERGAND